ncbi:pig-T [Schizosaccharomyces cryophilus OY26]|uniref:Pig-T n=1 Tax=Schizosaccharomyces cryophilus (strain OY26 / ATCC MYA-4695 / CBS 11777 / NBRC 106824 / NRRL Y48691) TaxID=653667 RepID=S9W502_SCHCR|nr:pig-T [Schizosaccharomyces cryophilus OY26]EPY53614.1 pig-T [Schizosaccharomyces cryophilus OY26]
MGLCKFVLVCLCSFFALGYASLNEQYNEALYLENLSNRHTYASFTFEIDKKTNKENGYAFSEPNYQFFPLSLARIMKDQKVMDLHVRATKGRWDYGFWKQPPDNGLQSGGLGFEVWASFIDDQDLEAWYKLTSQLSGLFCFSSNNIDELNTYQPLLSFVPSSFTSSHSRYFASLPQESVCTENLSSLLKFLPCKGEAGIASLIDSHLLFDTDWYSLSIDIAPNHPDDLSSMKLIVKIQTVIDVERTNRRKLGTKFPPPPEFCNDDIANDPLRCLTATYTSSSHTLEDLFHKLPETQCPLSPSKDDILVKNSPSLVVSYPLEMARDISVPVLPEKRPESPVFIERSLTNSGNHWVGIISIFTNPSDEAYSIVYFERLPWYARVYLHTMKITVNDKPISPLEFFQDQVYQPLKDRKAGTMIESRFEIPAHSSVVISYDIEKTTLRLQEYPPDANRGYDLPPSIVSVFGKDDVEICQLRTSALLMFIPTPDFSMPYNVIILTSTVMALTFGGSFNFLTRRIVPISELPKSQKPSLLQRLRSKLKRKDRNST